MSSPWYPNQTQGIPVVGSGLGEVFGALGQAGGYVIDRINQKNLYEEQEKRRREESDRAAAMQQVNTLSQLVNSGVIEQSTLADPTYTSLFAKAGISLPQGFKPARNIKQEATQALPTTLGPNQSAALTGVQSEDYLKALNEAQIDEAQMSVINNSLKKRGQAELTTPEQIRDYFKITSAPVAQAQEGAALATAQAVPERLTAEALARESEQQQRDFESQITKIASELLGSSPELHKYAAYGRAGALPVLMQQFENEARERAAKTGSGSPESQARMLIQNVYTQAVDEAQAAQRSYTDARGQILQMVQFGMMDEKTGQAQLEDLKTSFGAQSFESLFKRGLEANGISEEQYKGVFGRITQPPKDSAVPAPSGGRDSQAGAPPLAAKPAGKVHPLDAQMAAIPVVANALLKLTENPSLLSSIDASPSLTPEQKAYLKEKFRK